MDNYIGGQFISKERFKDNFILEIFKTTGNGDELSHHLIICNNYEYVHGYAGQFDFIVAVKDRLKYDHAFKFESESDLMWTNAHDHLQLLHTRPDLYEDMSRYGFSATEIANLLEDDIHQYDLSLG